MRSTNHISGFTLIELLIALVVFATLSLMAYGGLDAVIKADERLREHSSSLKRLQRTWMMLGQDLTQLIGRSIRDNYGTPQPALIASEMGEYLLEFTRGGWPNPKGVKRSQLQRVGYGVSDERLIRYSWSVLDRAIDSEPRQYALLENVRRLNLRFMDSKGGWHQSWPPLGDDSESLPIAAEVVLEFSNGIEFRRLFRTTDYVW